MSTIGVYHVYAYTVYRGQLQALLEFAYRGLQDGDLTVRNASLFAIGQFSDHLQVSGDAETGRKQRKGKRCILQQCMIIPTTAWPKSLAGNLFWWIGGF